MTDGEVADSIDPKLVGLPTALAAWTASDIGVDAAGFRSLLAQQVDEAWFESLPACCLQAHGQLGFD